MSPILPHRTEDLRRSQGIPAILAETTTAAACRAVVSTDGEGPLEQRRTSGGKPATGGNGRWPWGAPDSQHPTRTPRAENSPRLGLTCRAGGVLRPLRRFLRWSSAAPAVPRRGQYKGILVVLPA